MCARGPRRRKRAQPTPRPRALRLRALPRPQPELRRPSPSAGAGSRGSARERWPPGRTPAPFAAAVCTHVISSHYPGFQLADSGPESRARGELGHGATASPLEPLGPGRERLYPNSRPLASCVCVRPDVYTTTTCGHMSVFVCLMLCLHPRVLGRGGGRCARTPCRCREEGWGVGGTK